MEFPEYRIHSLCLYHLTIKRILCIIILTNIKSGIRTLTSSFPQTTRDFIPFIKQRDTEIRAQSVQHAEGLSSLQIAWLVVGLSFYYYLFSTSLVGESWFWLSVKTIEMVTCYACWVHIANLQCRNLAPIR
jgi:hypothetical protein